MRLFVLHGRLPERICSLGGRRVRQVLFIKPNEIGITAVPTKITRLRTPMMAPNAAVAAPAPQVHANNFRCHGHRFSGTTAARLNAKPKTRGGGLKLQVKAQVPGRSAPMNFLTASSLCGRKMAGSTARPSNTAT